MTRTAICTDSSAQLPAALRERTGAIVVPVSVTVGDRSFDEDELDVDAIYAQLAAGERVTTSQPSPGRFAQAYTVAAEQGARDIVSIHLTRALSGTIGSAELAAREAPVPVRVIDSGAASFGVAICVLAAADVLATGGSVADVAEAIARLAPRIGNVFVADPPTDGRIATNRRAQVLSLVGGAADSLGSVTSPAATVATMAEHIRSHAGSLRVAVGHAAASVAALADELAATLEASTGIDAVVRYRVGPSVGAHAGANRFGAFWWPG